MASDIRGLGFCLPRSFPKYPRSSHLHGRNSFDAQRSSHRQPLSVLP
jgi:hypothetical protein